MTAREGDPIELFLADAEHYRPALADGLPAEAMDAPKDAKRSNDLRLDIRDADPNDLPSQRWGVIVPEGDGGARLLEAIAPLLRLREEEQGAPPKLYNVPATMDAATAIRWREDVYRPEHVPDHERPRYLLILGDLHEVSLELQQALANIAFVGRLAFTTDNDKREPALDAYAAYAGKVVDSTKIPSPEEMPDARFFTADDDTPATRLAAARLVGPCFTRAEKQRLSGKFLAASVGEIKAASPDELLREAAASSRPSVLLTASHGLGAPRGGWKSDEQQRALQGALSLGGGNVLSAEVIGKRPFLRGGMWFCMACFGAGTPAESAYYPWLMELAREGAYEGRLDAVLKSLPKIPFVSALPQAALANPDGPLGVIGHADLAWSYAFSRGKGLNEGSAQKIFATIRTLVGGSRAGVGLDALMDFYRETTNALASSYQQEQNARAWKQADTTDRKARADLWMLSNDLRGYILLGDPAARLPLRRDAERHPKVVEPAPSPFTMGPQAAPDPGLLRSPAQGASVALPSVALKEELVFALLHGDEAPRALAARAGVSVKELWAWFDAYREGGRSRLGG